MKIKDGMIVKKYLQENEFCRSLKSELRSFKNYSFYLRGSMVESDNPHINADIDLYLIHKNGIIKEDIDLLLSNMAKYNRPVDLHIFNVKDFEDEIPNRLLLNTRSLHLAGPEVNFESVKVNPEMILQHWLCYNPDFAPDIMFSSVKSRVCALKNLTRCFGLINLIEEGYFTRDIPECMGISKNLNKTVYKKLADNWSIVDFQEPLYLKVIKDFIIDYKNEYLRKFNSINYKRYFDVNRQRNVYHLRDKVK